ncbi:hypothetical protein QBC33DRAFT_570048 [Phialemonium atrogriseum]|uniref:Uncharacterized protein n=1 Tax=Phialemonium atrogriseum TaxID=1093897 RepID=A0AAJ0C0Z2_9PEZI|nr:uncharacterized protein QBC33DRAFT_570048 [Phialemonium atrogriseum]KAK1767088.1 hypothetical protein QBC33DRAFT_570048 [Phialemonium atrogriseum]
MQCTSLSLPGGNLPAPAGEGRNTTYSPRSFYIRPTSPGTPGAENETQDSTERNTCNSPTMDNFTKKPRIYNPDETAYAVGPKNKYARNLLDILGIEESRLVPQAEPGSTRRRRTLKALRGWRPTQMRFTKEWPNEELPDGWYDMAYMDLFIRVQNFANKYFKFEDIPAVPGESPWLDGFSDEFIYYAGTIARQDKHRGGWDAILTSKATRNSLVIGVIAKVLGISVFDKLLFGADKVQEEMLAAQDEATIETEGYRRTDLRALSVRTCMGDDIVTPNFWPAVDALTMQLLALLLPALDLVDRHFAGSRAANPLRAVHQDLHHVVAEAAYLSIAIRWSGSIFRFVTPLPGQQWELDQDNVDNDVYEASKAAAVAAMPAAAAAPMQKGDGAGAETKGNLAAQPWLLAKVQIIQWPELQRWTPVGDPAAADPSFPDGDGDPGPGAGETVSSIMRSRVVYYAGVTGDEADAAEAVPELADYVRGLRAARRRRRVRPFALGAAAAAAAAAAVVAAGLLVFAVLVLLGGVGGDGGVAGAEAARARGLVEGGLAWVAVAWRDVLSWLFYLWDLMGRVFGQTGNVGRAPLPLATETVSVPIGTPGPVSSPTGIWKFKAA